MTEPAPANEPRRGRFAFSLATALLLVTGACAFLAGQNAGRQRATAEFLDDTSHGTQLFHVDHLLDVPPREEDFPISEREGTDKAKSLPDGPFDARRLVDRVRSEVDPQGWVERGGVARLEFDPAKRHLLVHANLLTRRRVGELLEVIERERAARANR